MAPARTWLAGFVVLLLAGCQACEQLDQPYAYRCDRDAGAAECRSGWRCGLDGFCFDPSVERVVKCEVDSDCAATYRCGTPLKSESSPQKLCRQRDVRAGLPLRRRYGL